MDNKIYEELAQDKEFLTALADAEGFAEMQKIFTSNGIDLTLSEVEDFWKSVEAMGNDELNEYDLVNVSGGCDPIIGGLVVIGIALYAVWKDKKNKKKKR